MNDLSDMPKPTDFCWWVLVFLGWFGRLRFDAFVREGDVMNGENEQQEPLVKGENLNAGGESNSFLYLFPEYLPEYPVSDRQHFLYRYESF
jgi:hypothetical protein